MHDLFMSYSRRNRRFINRLVADLKEHHIDVWLDTIELEVGDLVHYAIDEAIANSRYFCLAISPPALASYYVRQVEFESAFARLVRERRDSFILPILVQPIHEELPVRLAGLFYLNFTNRKHYTQNMRDLAKKVKLQDANYTGNRWYKALDISPFGEPVGVGELSQMAPTGASYDIHWNRGSVTQVDVYLNQKKVNYKKFGYDSQGRVVENMMYSPDGEGGWHVVDDVWYYSYDKKTGRRSKKFMKILGAKSGRELSYDTDGRVTEENIISTDGTPTPDPSFGYVRKTFDYSPEGHLVKEHWFDQDGVEIKAVMTGQ